MNTILQIPADGAYFEGHFPGSPILPGVTQLVLILEKLAEATGRPMGLRELVFMRMRQPVLPGDRLELLASERDGGRLRFSLQRESVVVTNGELILGPHHPPCPAQSDMAAEPIAQFPDLDALLPHRTPMRFVTGIVDMAERSLISSVEIPASCPLVHAGYTPVLVGIEAAAQTAATWEALRRWRETGNAAPRIGYLVTLRDLMFYTEQLPAGESMRVSVCLEALAPPLTHYRVELTRDGRTLLRGTIATYLSNGMPQLVPPEIPDSPGNDL